MAAAMDYVFIGDDFTGASDSLATLAQTGRRARLFLAPPETEAAIGLDAVGVATDLRAAEPAAIRARLATLARDLVALRPRILHYKVCSTFDSAPHVGNIAAAMQTLETAFDPVATLILGGQPSLGRHCLFGHLFARAPDGVTHRIDRHPIMSRHPVTPMGEADLALHLAAQGARDIEKVTRPDLPTLAARLAGRAASRPRLLLDAVDQSDIETIAAALRRTCDGALLIVGASSVVEACFGAPANRPDDDAGALPTLPGPRLAIAGSRSSRTAQQVATATRYERMTLSADDLATGLEQCAARIARGLAAGRNMLAALDPQADYGLSSQALSERLAQLAARIVDAQPVRAIAVAGGDTSSAIVAALGFTSLSYEGRCGAGVAVCRGHSDRQDRDGARLLLKGGQLGPTDLFDRFAGSA